MIIAVPSEDSFAKIAVNAMLNMPPHHIGRYSDQCLKNIANIFGLELLEIYHESIQPEHIDFYKGVIWAKKFLPTPLVDPSLKRKLINKAGIVGRKFISIPKNEYGHTVIGIYRKPNAA